MRRLDTRITDAIAAIRESGFGRCMPRIRLRPVHALNPASAGFVRLPMRSTR
jgi:hypothetical protein